MKHNLVELRTMAVVGPRDPVLPEAAPFVPMDAVKVGIRHPVYTESRGRRGGVRARANDVLFARITPCLENGKVAQLPADSQPTGGSTEFLVVRPGPELDPGFLYYWSLSPRIRDLAQAKMTGTTGRMRLGGKDLATFPIPRFDLAEQRRIVEILEDHLSRLDAADRDLSDCHRRQDAWTKGTLQHLIWGASQPVTEVSRVLREPMRNGRSDRASNEPNAVRTLTLTAVTKRDFSDTNTKLTSTSREIARGLWLQRGDILVQRSNTPELVGTSARYDGPDDWAIFPDLLIRLRSDESVMDSRFLAAALRSERAHRSLRAKAKGLAGSMPKIDQGALGATLVPLPPLIDQQTVCMQIDEVMAASTRLRDAIVAARRRGGALRRGVLAAAFEGKLTGRHTDAEVIEESAAAEPEEGRM